MIQQYVIKGRVLHQISHQDQIRTFLASSLAVSIHWPKGHFPQWVTTNHDPYCPNPFGSLHFSSLCLLIFALALRSYWEESHNHSHLNRLPVNLIDFFVWSSYDSVRILLEAFISHSTPYLHIGFEWVIVGAIQQTTLNSFLPYLQDLLSGQISFLSLCRTDLKESLTFSWLTPAPLEAHLTFMSRV